MTPAPLPRIIIAGLAGGSGKTLVSLGLTRALVRAGLAVAPFKKGPDYIDAKWLALAAGRPTTNLDTHLMAESAMTARFVQASQGCAISVIEGNRGVFDGMDSRGSLSTAALATKLSAPVILTLDATKMTRTAAAVVAGVNTFEPGFSLAGVVLNRTAGPRHRALLTECIEGQAGVPVLGCLPKLVANPIPERHMGLMSDQEMRGEPGTTVDSALDELGELIAKHLDLDRIRAIADSAPTLNVSPPVAEQPACQATVRPRIGVVRDAALWFYYPENLQALEAAGAELAFVSILDDAPWPELHGLYLGGGFPETHAAELASNDSVRERVRELANSGAPIYAECGGFMYLAEGLEVDGRRYPMAGVLPVNTRLCERPQGLGYVTATVKRDNPFHPHGVALRGHEFHYSRCQDAASGELALTLDRGQGMSDGCDGLVQGNVFAAYCHIHALGSPHWAPNFVEAARAFLLGASPPTPHRGR